MPVKFEGQGILRTAPRVIAKGVTEIRIFRKISWSVPGL